MHNHRTLWWQSWRCDQLDDQGGGNIVDIIRDYIMNEKRFRITWPVNEQSHSRKAVNDGDLF